MEIHFTDSDRFEMTGDFIDDLLDNFDRAMRIRGIARRNGIQAQLLFAEMDELWGPDLVYDGSDGSFEKVCEGLESYAASIKDPAFAVEE